MVLLFLFLIVTVSIVSVCKIIGFVLLLGFIESSVTKYQESFPKRGVLYPYPR